MREHEVPTHVQAEDRVLLWFTFPQVVAMTAVCALSYGVYSYAPGPSELRMALAVILGLAGIAVIVGRIGGRRLPLVVADLLRYRLGARLYAGRVSQLVRSESPAPARRGPGLRWVRLIALRARRRRRRKKRRGEAERQNGRRPFGPLGRLGRRSQQRVEESAKAEGTGSRRAGRRKIPKTWLEVLAVAALALAVAAPSQAALADGEDGGWSSPEIEFRPPEPVEGRRLFVEGLSVNGDRAAVNLRAATELELRVRAYGGGEGQVPLFWGAASLAAGERVDYSLPLDGPTPSFTFSWTDALGQAGAVSLEGGQIPYPLPTTKGGLCDLRVVSLGWRLGSLEGTVASQCATKVEEVVELQTVTGHASVAQRALMDAEVAAITGTLSVVSGESETSVPFVLNGETAFRLPVETGEAAHDVAVEVDLEAGLRIAMPPLVRLTHRPERSEERTRTVRLVRPGTSESVSEVASVTHEDGTTTQHTISATLSIPSETVYKEVTLTVVHPERVEAELMERGPMTRSRRETLALESSVGADATFRTLRLPEPEPEPQRAEQTPLSEGEMGELFDLLGWEWPW